MNRGDILMMTAELTMGAKVKEHGNGTDTALKDNFKQAAQLWSAYLGTPVDSVDVANMMVLLKMSRSMQNGKGADHYVDMCGYAAIAGELALGDSI